MSHRASRPEEIILKIRCKCNNLTGDLIVSHKGVSFEKADGFLGTGRKRIHHFSFDDLQNVRIESKGIGHSLIGSVALAIDHRTPALGNRTNRYNMQKGSAEQVIASITGMRQAISAPEELEDFLIRLIKPEGKADLRVMASLKQVRELVAYTRGIRASELWDADSFSTIRNSVASLIADGRLDGIIDESDHYVSSVMITRKSIQYQVVIDFASLFGQLENKGIILQSLDCPSCAGKIDYPKNGASINCRYCGATIQAIDIFEKFKGLLT